MLHEELPILRSGLPISCELLSDICFFDQNAPAHEMHAAWDNDVIMLSATMAYRPI